MAGKRFTGTDGVQAKSALGKTVAPIVKSREEDQRHSLLNCSRNLYPHAETATTPDRPGAKCPDNLPHMNQHVHKVEPNLDDAAPSIQGNWAPLLMVVDYWPVTANQNPAELPGTAGDVTRMIGAIQ